MITWKLLRSLALFLALAATASAARFVAYSMREAENRLRQSAVRSGELVELGGITRLAGMVYDSATKDWIVVGQVGKGQKTSLEHLVVALRSVLVHKTWPAVSIDKTPDSDRTRLQSVRFEGGIANTAFGQQFLEADVVLKKLALGYLRSDVWGVPSYFDLSAERLRQTGVEEVVSSRFWFDIVGECLLAQREGVAAIGELRLGVLPQVLSMNGKPVNRGSEARDELADRFASALTASFQEVSQYYPEVGRLRALFDFLALARGIQSQASEADLRFWLNDYAVIPVQTPKTYELLHRRLEMPASGEVRVLQLDGGIELRALLSNLRDGDPNALRAAVLKSRPKGNALTWTVPLDQWPMPGGPAPEPEQERAEAPQSAAALLGIGTSVTRMIGTLGASEGNIKSYDLPSPSITKPAEPKITFTDRSPFRSNYGNIGGVMLSGAATVSGGEEAKVDLSRGNFSLIVGGQSARLAPQAFRKFITALWSLYYSKQDPGISIDPIAPGVDKHLVRYIGNVVNTDLGRVMRECDYVMKKWAVGTERPDIPGFRDVDDLTASHGLHYLGAHRRFWFVPEDMTFRRGGDALLFADGRMTVKTEYVFQNKGVRAEPADERFAQFFTSHYREIAERYPFYQELFEYARLVSLAKYLKDSGIPLFWFLMANKDLVLTEDSPGTVDALARGSRNFEGVTIQGGVDLRTEGRYVYDQSAVAAINEAISRLPASAFSRSTTSLGATLPKTSSEPFSFNLGKESYSVLPQHSLTSGKDSRGIRYQTDLGLRSSGLPGLEVVRYYDPSRQDGGEFGQGWRLLVPYRIRPLGSTQTKFLNVLVPEKMAIENLLTQQHEVLTFSTDRYSIAGYVPDKLASSQLIGLFLLSDASFRLADKLGNEFWFDPAGHLSDMVFSRDHRVHIEYAQGFTSAFPQGPYRLEPAGEERLEFLNVRVPTRMKIVDLVHGGTETLAFSDQGKIAGYVPTDPKQSRFEILALLSDASFQLLDKTGNETRFDPAGNFEGMAISSKPRMVRSISQGDSKVEFAYSMDRSGRVRIATATLSKGKDAPQPAYAVNYHYDDEGRLTQVEGNQGTQHPLYAARR